MNRFRFVRNIPQIVSLAQSEAEYDADTAQSSYQLSDGRTLVLGTSDATRLNLLELQPGETFGLCRRYQDEKLIATNLDIWLTPATEQDRAATEQLNEQPTPAKPVQPKPRRRKVVEMRPDPPAQPTTQQTQGNGTYGPAPIPQPALATARRTQIPWNVAFVEVVKFVTQGLKDAGEQWNDAAKQDACSTVLIAASKAGLIGLWER